MTLNLFLYMTNNSSIVNSPLTSSKPPTKFLNWLATSKWYIFNFWLVEDTGFVEMSLNFFLCMPNNSSIFVVSISASSDSFLSSIVSSSSTSDLVSISSSVWLSGSSLGPLAESLSPSVSASASTSVSVWFSSILGSLSSPVPESWSS